jgi:hypothetical protein
MGRLDTEREALRLRSVQDIIQARNVQSEIAYRETSGDLNKAQAARLRAEEPHIAAKMLADIDQSREAAGASRAQRISTETLLPERVAQERAQTGLYQAQSNRVTELLGLEKQNIRANIEQSMAAVNASNANAERIRQLYPREAALLDKQNDEYVKLKIGGQEFSAKGMTLAQERNENIQKMMQLEKERAEKIAKARTDARTEMKVATDAEQNLRSKRPGGYALQNSYDESELAPEAELFHATSKQPYVYIFEDNPGRIYSGTRMKKIDLPTVDGHRYTAQEVYDAAQNYPSGAMNVQQYLEQVFYPSLKQPIPWKLRPKE